MKLVLLFYQIRYSRENNRHSFVFQKCKTTNGKPEWTAGELRKFKLCKNQSFETNRFTRSKQSGSSSRQKTCIRWILIRLNSEFHAMLSWTLLDMLARLNEENKSNWPNYLLPIARTLTWITVVLSNIIFQRKQASLLWILEVQNNKCQMERMTELERFAVLNYAKIRVSRQIHLHRVTTICFNLVQLLFRKLACAGF